MEAMSLFLLIITHHECLHFLVCGVVFTSRNGNRACKKVCRLKFRLYVGYYFCMCGWQLLKLIGCIETDLPSESINNETCRKGCLDVWMPYDSSAGNLLISFVYLNYNKEGRIVMLVYWIQIMNNKFCILSIL